MTRSGMLMSVLAYALPCGAVLAQESGGVELRIGQRRLVVGEAVDAQLVCTNTPRPGLPKTVVPDGLELKLLNQTPSTQQYMQFINGRRFQQTTYTYPMRLVAVRAGSYTLGPVTVEAEGETFRTAPMTIVVEEPADDATPEGDRFAFAELTAAPEAVYVTQEITAELTFGVRRVVIDGRTIPLDTLSSVLDQRASQFGVFADPANRTVRRSRRWLADSTGASHEYDVFRITKTVRAEQVGELRIGPVFLKFDYPTAVRRSFFGDLEVSRSRRVTAHAEAAQVTVKAPPEEGRPATYTGAIGTYTLEVSARPTTVEQGQPITLTIAIRGEPLEGVAGPDLTQQAQLVSRFSFTSDELIGDIEGGARMFRRAIFPKQAGEQTIPPISWSFFDPAREVYETLRSEPIPIVVERREGETAVAVADEAPGVNDTVKLRRLTGGIQANYEDPGRLLADHSFSLTPAWFMAMAGAPLVWGVLTLTARYQARLRSDVRWARRRRARSRANSALDRAMNNGTTDEQLHQIAAAVTGYVADRFGLETSSLTPAEVAAVLKERGVDDHTKGSVVGFLETCDSLRFAPGAAGEVSIPDAVEKARRWIRKIESVPGR